MNLIRAIMSILHPAQYKRDDFDLDYERAHAFKRLNESVDRFCDTVDSKLARNNGNGHAR